MMEIVRKNSQDYHIGTEQQTKKKIHCLVKAGLKAVRSECTDPLLLSAANSAATTLLSHLNKVYPESAFASVTLLQPCKQNKKASGAASVCPLQRWTVCIYVVVFNQKSIFKVISLILFIVNVW